MAVQDSKSYIICVSKDGLRLMAGNDILTIEWQFIESYKSYLGDTGRKLIGLNMKYELMTLLTFGIKNDNIWDISVAESMILDHDRKSMLLRKLDMDYFVRKYGDYNNDTPSFIKRICSEQYRTIKNYGDGSLTTLQDRFSEFFGEVLADYYGIKYTDDDYEILGGIKK